MSPIGTSRHLLPREKSIAFNTKRTLDRPQKCMASSPKPFLIFRNSLDRWVETGICRFVSRLTEGRFAIVTKRWARDAVDAWAAQDGRGSRRTAKSCGPDAPTLASTRDDASHHAGMVARKPGHQGEREGKHHGVSVCVFVFLLCFV